MDGARQPLAASGMDCIRATGAIPSRVACRVRSASGGGLAKTTSTRTSSPVSVLVISESRQPNSSGRVNRWEGCCTRPRRDQQPSECGTRSTRASKRSNVCATARRPAQEVAHAVAGLLIGRRWPGSRLGSRLSGAAGVEAAAWQSRHWAAARTRGDLGIACSAAKAGGLLGGALFHTEHPREVVGGASNGPLHAPANTL